MFSAAVVHNLLMALAPWWHTLQVLAYLMGFFIVGVSLIKLAKVQHHSHMASPTSIAAVISGVAFGSMLCSLPSWMDALSETFFNQPSASSLVTPQQMGNSLFSNSLALGYAVLQLVGLWGIIKGARLFVRAPQDGEKLGMAFAYTIGGIFSVNIITFMTFLANSVGGSLAQVIHQHFLPH